MCFYIKMVTADKCMTGLSPTVSWRKGGATATWEKVKAMTGYS